MAKKTGVPVLLRSMGVPQGLERFTFCCQLAGNQFDTVKRKVASSICCSSLKP
ncbi:MAG: hypothetical protein AAGG44_05280 [Planctomycetota bacterium]